MPVDCYMQHPCLKFSVVHVHSVAMTSFVVYQCSPVWADCSFTFACGIAYTTAGMWHCILATAAAAAVYTVTAGLVQQLRNSHSTVHVGWQKQVRNLRCTNQLQLQLAAI